MNSKKFLLLFLLIIILGASLYSFHFLKTDRTYGDENIHSWQIQQFLSGDFKLHPNLTTLPGYHYAIYFFSKIFGTTSIFGMRYITFAFGILAVLIFYFCAKFVSPNNANAKTLQFFFLPILFQYFFLIYTDVASLFLVLLALFFALKKQNIISFIIIFLSLFIRQTNIIWLLFIFVAIFVREYQNNNLPQPLPASPAGRLRKEGNKKGLASATKAYTKFPPRTLGSTNIKGHPATVILSVARRIPLLIREILHFVQDDKNNNWAVLSKGVLNHCKKNFIYIAGIIAFIIFTFFNKGFALGDKEMHPWFSFHMGNIYIALIAFFFLFLPLNIYNFKKIVAFIKKKPIVLGFLFILFFIYIFTSSYTHHYNEERYVFYIKNVLLVFLNKNTLVKLLFFLPIAYSILSLMVTKLHENWQYLTYPAAILMLLPSSLIEHRYYIIPFSLFILFKQKQPKWVEYSQITIFIATSLGIIFGLSQEKFFF